MGTRAWSPRGERLEDRLVLSTTPAIGVGLDGISPYSSQLVFNDAFLESSDWVSQAYDTVTHSETWGAGPALSVNANDWPTQLVTYTGTNGDMMQQRAGTLMFRDINGNYPAGVYTAEWQGSGTVTFGYDASVIQQGVEANGTNYALLNVTPSNAGIYLEIAATNPTNPITNIHVWMPGPNGQAQTGQVWAPGDDFSPFTPEFLAELQPFSTLRMMDWMDTNLSSVTDWSNVRPLSYARQSNGTNGVSPQYMIELANELQENLWINLPYQSDANYNTQLATLIQQTLDPNLKVYVEWSNEVWNGQFPTSAWIESQLALPQNAGLDFAGFEAQQISTDFTIWSQAFSSQSDRLVRVVSGQGAEPNQMDELLGDLNGQYDAISTAAYITLTPAQLATFSASTTSDDVLNDAFADLSTTYSYIESFDGLAQKYSTLLGRQIPLVAYEGGQQFTANGQVVAYQQALYDAEVNPRIYNLYEQLITEFAALGGTLFMHYSNISENSTFGSYGALQYTGEPISQAPKYEALLDAATGAWASTAGTTTVSQYHYNASDNGVDATETALTPTDVTAATFGALFSTPLDGQVYAEPLYVPNVTITAGQYAGSVYNVVYVATENDSLYAIDANSGLILWQDTYVNAAAGITAIPATDVDAADIAPTIGITGTPVIDSTTNTIYFVTNTMNVVSGVDHFVQSLQAVNLGSGAPQFGGTTVIGDTTYDGSAYINITNVSVNGNAPDAVNGVVSFNALRELQRSALVLDNGTVYIEFASHGDVDPYHGWVLGYNASTLALAAVWNATPNGSEGGIWESGAGLTVDSNGDLYLCTGNGTFDTTLDGNGFPIDGDYGDSVVKLAVDPTTSAANQNINGWGLQTVDYFTPSNQQMLDDDDLDLSSTGVLLLPTSAGSAEYPNLLLVSGKQGVMYLLNANNMGKYDPSGDQVVQEVSGVFNSGEYGSPAFYNGTLYVPSSADYAMTFTIANAQMSTAPTSESPDQFSYPGSNPVISSDGTSNGIVWDLDVGTDQLRTYNAANGYANEIYTSAQAANNRDALSGSVMHFATPTVANGEVFVGTSDSLMIFGLLSSPTSPPPTPTQLSATTVSSNEVNLTWSTDIGTETGFNIEASTDGMHFTQIGVAPAGSLSYTVSSLSYSTTYTFRVEAFNAYGPSGWSNTATTTTGVSAGLTSVDLSSGFAAAAQLLTLNGTSAINGAMLTLTNGGQYQAASAFTTSLANVSTFTTQFSFQLLSPQADGFTFTIQDDAPTALGGVGGELGFGADGFSGGHPAITNSTAVTFDFDNSIGAGDDALGLYVNGASPATGSNSIDLTSTGINLRSGHVFDVGMTYDGTTLTVTITDTATGTAAVEQFPVSIGPSAYIGFTAGTGGLSSTQEILNWTFATGYTPLTTPAPPSNLTAAYASGAVTLDWSESSTDQTGFEIDRQTGINGSFVPLTTSVAPTATSFVDTTVVSGNEYFYRIRALGTGGNSGYSNQASVVATGAATSVNFASGFSGASSLLDLNGSAALSGNALVLTNGGLYQAASAFTNTQFSTSLFSTQFNFQLTNPQADGFTFTIQNDAPTALGGVGGELGYGADGYSGGHPAITNSVAVTFDFDNSVGAGNDDMGLYVNGASPATAASSIDLTPMGIHLRSGDTFQVSITYNGTTLAVTITDTVTGATATEQYAVSIPSAAYVGFTAGTGGLSSTQQILNWGFTSGLSSSSPPAAPSNLTATANGNTQVTLDWTNNATNQTSFIIQRSTGNDTNFSTIGTAAANATSFVDAAVGSGGQYYYRVAATNASGNSNYSNEANVTVSTAAVNYPAGFAGAGAALTLNGSAAINGGLLVLTNGGLYQTASAFTTSEVNVATFNTQFSFQLVNPQADGFTFTIQSQAPTALGGVGGELGYGADGFSGGHPAITNSVAVTFDFDNGVGAGNNDMGLYVNGASPATGQNSVDLTPTGLNLRSGHVFYVSMTYNGSTLTVSLSDTTTSITVTENYSVSLGSSMAYAGFTAGTGGLTSTQEILNWTFNSGASSTSPPAAPTSLTATATGSAQATLNWTNNATNQTGFVVQRSTGNDANFATIGTAAANATSYVDNTVSNGLQYYYRVYATNSGGNSGYSNEANVTVAVATVNLATGFAGSSGLLTLNGSAAVSGNDLVLTNGGLYQSASAFTSAVVSTATFTTQFSFQLLNPQADGFTFTIQDQAPTALGGVGGQLGYGADGFSGGHPAITNSMAVTFDFYNSVGTGNDDIGLYLNGASPAGGANSTDLTPTGINLRSGHVFNVALSYNGTTLAVSITDATTQATASESYTVSIPTSAYVGFTAGTGGLSSTQEILNWTFNSGSGINPAVTSAPETPAWQNPANPLDVLGQGGPIVPLDALVLIDYLNLHGSTTLPMVRPTGAYFLDVLGTNTVTPTAVLKILDYLNSHPDGSSTSGFGSTAVALSLSATDQPETNRPAANGATSSSTALGATLVALSPDVGPAAEAPASTTSTAAFVVSPGAVIAVPAGNSSTTLIGPPAGADTEVPTFSPGMGDYAASVDAALEDPSFELSEF